MNLQRISFDTAYKFIIPKACLHCQGDINSRTDFADLDGEPFKAYYCDKCFQSGALRRGIDFQK